MSLSWSASAAEAGCANPRRCRVGLRSFASQDKATVKTRPIQPSLIPVEPNASVATGGDVTDLDRSMGPDDALVHDTLCALQAPSGLTRVSDMMTAAGLRTERGSAFNPTEVRRVIDRLLAAGHATRDAQGRVRAALPHGAARFREMMRPPRRAQAWFEAWCKLIDFDRAHSLGFQEEDQLAAAMRLVIFGGRSLRHLQRLSEQIGRASCRERVLVAV